MIEKLEVQPPFPDNDADQNVDIVLKINEIIDIVNELNKLRVQEIKDKFGIK